MFSRKNQQIFTIPPVIYNTEQMKKKTKYND